MACPGWASYGSSTEDRNSNSRDIIKFSQGFRSKVKSQGDIFQKGCAEVMAADRRCWRDWGSRENATTGEAKYWWFIYWY